MARGRRCCCCKNFYTSQGLNLVKIQDNKGIVSTTAIGALSSPIFTFDLVNKALFARSQVNTKAIIRSDDKLTTIQPVFTTTGVIISVLVAYPQQSKIIYSTTISGNTSIRTVDYNGNNDTEILNFGTYGTNVMAMATDGTLYYNKFKSGPTVVQINRVKYDGTGDTNLLADSVVTWGSNVRQMAFDNVNKVLYVDTGILKINRMNFDGTGQSTILDRATAQGVTLPSTSGNNYGLYMVGYSHLYQRVFFFLNNTGDSTKANMGLYSMKGDGTDIRQEVIKPNFVSSTGAEQLDPYSSNRFQLGCGLEQTGPTTLGSSAGS